MEWSFECPNGGVTVRQEGERAVCQAIGRIDGNGLYKAWLRGETGRALLGTLIPEGGALRLRRTVSVSQLQGQGAWPPTGAEIAMAYAFFQEAALPEGWRWTDCPCRLMEDRELSHAMRGLNRALLKRDTEGFFLAAPFDERCPFPVAPLFCLGRVERMEGRAYVVFRFSRQGRPEPLHNFSPEGDNGSGI